MAEQQRAAAPVVENREHKSVLGENCGDFRGGSVRRENEGPYTSFSPEREREELL